jgi:predicted Zn-dependent peptidase
MQEIKKLFSAMLVCALFAGSALAQQQPSALPSPVTNSVKGAQLKGKAPVNPHTLKVTLPRPEETVLQNGLRVALLEDHKLSTFSVQMIVHGGGLADPNDLHGLAMITAAMLDEGTASRTSREIAERLALLGASFSASATPSSGESTVTISGLVDNFAPTLELFADLVRNPAFPPAELDKLKARLHSQVQYWRSLPNFAAKEGFMHAIYGEHPASLLIPPDAALNAMKSADLQKYHRAYFLPNNVSVLAYGDVKLKELVTQVNRVFGDWKQAEVNLPKTPTVEPPAKARVLLLNRRGSVQTSLLVGGLGIERTSPDYFAMLVMNYILGGGPASRLFMNLREDKGYTYGASSDFSGSSFPGVVVASTDVRNEVTEGALHELQVELDRIRNEPVPASELENAKHALIGRFALSLESPQTLLAMLATQKIYALPADYWDKYPEHVEAITAADIKKVADKYYRADRLQIVAVGDAAVVRKALEKYGDVEMPGADPEQK